MAERLGADDTVDLAEKGDAYSVLEGMTCGCSILSEIVCGVMFCGRRQFVLTLLVPQRVGREESSSYVPSSLISLCR